MNSILCCMFVLFSIIECINELVSIYNIYIYMYIYIYIYMYI